jgi:hypothetical protein
MSGGGERSSRAMQQLAKGRAVRCSSWRKAQSEVFSGAGSGEDRGRLCRARSAEMAARGDSALAQEGAKEASPARWRAIGRGGQY